MKKKIIIGVVIAGVVIAAVAFLLKGQGQSSSGGEVAYVESISTILGSSASSSDRFAGVVEAQDSVKVNKNQDKKVAELLVSVGDQVTPTTVLFRYDISDAQKEVDSINLDIEALTNDITDTRAQISDGRISGSNAVAIAENEIRSKQLQIQQKQLDLASKQKEIDGASVLANTTGTIKAINENPTDAQGNSVAYIEISQSGEFRVKGTVDENSIHSLTVGQEMIVRSRVDETKFWTGKITEIKTDPNVQQNSMYGFGSSSNSAESSSTYPFYISLDSSDGLMLGQHVYTELNTGTAVHRDGIWLDASFVMMDGDKTYLWVAGKNDRLEKREVEVGELDTDLYVYEIKSGVSEADRIAWPMENYKEGMATESFSMVGSDE